MLFIFLLGLSAFLLAGSAACFSVLGIATLFAGSFYQVAIMAGALEFSKLIATSFLYRYWDKTSVFLRTYLIIAILTLMGITSMGIFGYLSAAYQVNSAKYTQVDSRIELIETQKKTLDGELLQINVRLDTLNKSRISQEQRLPNLSSRAAKPIYDDIARSAEEIKQLNKRIQELQTAKSQTDSQIIELKEQIVGTKDIGTFKFIAQAFNTPLDNVVKFFICVLIVVFDPMAVSLVLAFNIATKKSEQLKKNEQPVEHIVTVNSDVYITQTQTPTQTSTPSPSQTHTVSHTPTSDYDYKQYYSDNGTES